MDRPILIVSFDIRREINYESVEFFCKKKRFLPTYKPAHLPIPGDKIFQCSTCPAGQMTYNFHSSCKHMYLSFTSVCNKEHKGVICNMTSSSNSSQSTRPVGRVLWEELLVLSRFHLLLPRLLRADEWNFYPLNSLPNETEIKNNTILFLPAY